MPPTIGPSDLRSWMDRHGKVAYSDDDQLEDRIIAALQELPGRIAVGDRV